MIKLITSQENMNIIKTTKPYYSLYDLILTEINPTAEEIKNGHLLYRDCGAKAHVISSKGHIPVCNVSFEDLMVPKIQLASKALYDPHKYKNFEEHVLAKAKDSVERLIDFETFRLLACATQNEHTIKSHLTKVDDETFNFLIGLIESHDLPTGLFILNPLTYRQIESQLHLHDKHSPKNTYVSRYDTIPIYTSVMCQQNVIFLVAPKEYVGVLVNYGSEENIITEQDKIGYEVIKNLGFAVVNDYAVAKIICT